MYFWIMKVRDWSKSLSAMICLIALIVLHTDIPTPLFVFSPGFTIHIFLGATSNLSAFLDLFYGLVDVTTGLIFRYDFWSTSCDDFVLGLGFYLFPF